MAEPGGGRPGAGASLTVRAVDCPCGAHLVAADDAALAALVATHDAACHPDRGPDERCAGARRRAWVAARAYWELAPAWRDRRGDRGPARQD